MEREASSISTLGVVLIALGVLIAIGFGVFAIARETANEGVTGVQENLNVVSQSAFTDYDQKVVTGTQVVSAYNNFSGKPYAILIATQATQKVADPVGTAAPNLSGGSGVAAAYGTGGPQCAVYTKSGGKAVVFINYNALLTNDEATGAGGVQTPGKLALKYVDNSFRTEKQSFATSSDGQIQFNNTTSNISKSGMMEYVPSGGRFQANLIKDDSGTILGIAFEQLAR